MPWRRRLFPFLRPLYRLSLKVRRGMTLGARGVVVDGEGRVLLIEHTYAKGWFLPGGGVERGESVDMALARELAEEAGVRPTGPARLVSIVPSSDFPGDHVAYYCVRRWEACGSDAAGEVLHKAWFAPDALPDDVNPQSREQIARALRD
jgi:8-oxo-dGTP pyrophosphatase MutT (NUDIX family)